MIAQTPLLHHVCPYLCCHLSHAAGECPLESCEDEQCDGPACWWFDKRADPPPGVGHFEAKWITVHRDGSVPQP